MAVQISVSSHGREFQYALLIPLASCVVEAVNVPAAVVDGGDDSDHGRRGVGDVDRQRQVAYGATAESIRWRAISIATSRVVLS